MIIQSLSIVINRKRMELRIVTRIHARKLYLASLFRCFDEADYSPAQDKPYPVVRVHEPREPVNEMPADDAVGDGRVCTLKNTLRNGIVIGALERRYDHMVLIGEGNE